MKWIVIYLVVQFLLLLVVGFHDPLLFIAIPLGLVATYSLMIAIARALIGPRQKH
jgi:hypothetical protein